MKTFNDLDSQNVRWLQKSMFSQDYDLQADTGEVVATMKRPSMWKSTVIIEAIGNRWTLDRKGFWQRRIEISSVGTGEQPAVFHYKGQGGELHFADGRVFYWRGSNWWGTKWAWTDAQGEPIIGFRTGGAFRLNGELNLDPDIMEAKSMSLLVFLGWYLIVLHQEDRATMVAAAG